MAKEKVKIDISKLGLTGEVSKKTAYEVLVLKWRQYKIDVSIKPDGSKDCVIIGGQERERKDFINRLTDEKIFIESEIIGDCSTIVTPKMPWLA